MAFSIQIGHRGAQKAWGCCSYWAAGASMIFLTLSAFMHLIFVYTRLTLVVVCVNSQVWDVKEETNIDIWLLFISLIATSHSSRSVSRWRLCWWEWSQFLVRLASYLFVSSPLKCHNWATHSSRTPLSRSPFVCNSHSWHFVKDGCLLYCEGIYWNAVFLLQQKSSKKYKAIYFSFVDIWNLNNHAIM